MRGAIFECQCKLLISWNRLLEKFKLFSAFYILTELRGREDLVIGIIENLDFSMCVLLLSRMRWACGD